MTKPSPIALSERSPEPEPAPETRFAVFRNPGPGTYRGALAHSRRGVLPVGCEVSLPPDEQDAAGTAGLLFVRWARGEA